MTNKDIFRIWAPVGAKWTDWVRPVPFITSEDEIKTYEYFDFSIPSINYINELYKDTAIIIDIPGYSSVKEGIALSKIGYRPIPLFNGTIEQEGSTATVNNSSLEIALVWGAYELQKTEIEKDASPVFLLDTNRLNRFKSSLSIFDNSWDIYAQDMPSGEYFLGNGIKKIIVRGEKIQKDLKLILYKYQQKGIKLLFTDGYEEAKEIKLRKPMYKERD